MTRFLRSLTGRLGRSIRRRPRTTLVLVVAALLAGTAAGLYGYAVREWHRAVVAVREGRPSEARSRLETCLRVWPSDPDVHRLAARAARQTGDFVAAESHLNRCLQLERGASEDTQLEFLLMRALTGEADEVSGLLFGYVERGHPDAQLVLEALAAVYMRNYRYGPAHYVLRRWVEAFPEAARPYHYRGWVLERMNQPKGALDDYLRALELDPELDQVRLRVAEMYLEDKQPLSALPHLEYLQARTPDRPEVLARLGQCWYLQGRHADARAELERAVEQLPDDPGVLLYLGRLDVEEGHPARAEQRLRRALAADPSDTEVRYVLVRSLHQQGKEAAAAAEQAEYERHKDLLERANHLLQEEARGPAAPTDPAPAAEIGKLLLQIGQDRQGLYWMDTALARDPKYRPAHEVLAEYFERKGDGERAATHRRFLK